MDRIIERLVRAATLALALAFIFAVLLNFANVIGRYVFSRAILGADEVQVFVMVWMTFLGAVVVTWRDRHLRMDVLVAALPASVGRALRIIEVVLLVVLAAFVLVQSWRYTALMASIDRRSEAAGIPMVVPHGALVTGFALMALIGLVRLWTAVRSFARRFSER